MVTTRLQAKTKPKRVRFADETSVTGEEDATQREEANGVPTEDSVRLETELSRVTAPNGTTPTLPDAEDVDPLTVQRERRRRIATAQDEELRDLKTVLRGGESTLTYRAARDAWKMCDHFVLSEDDALYYVGTRPLRGDQQQEDAMLRLVVPSTMIQEVLQNCHDSLEGGHQGIARTFYRVKLDYYWTGLYADVARHVRSCPDCQAKADRGSVDTLRGTY
ncbi:reverse transcriptase [Phytophthora megakarya]|uniref:Reverse transcriptase n=1 Tax=Phytophthora megakarya TaxID=4795 RepID=A0A225UJY4_9STRA|nr:reverse transcriptase [Phytophthora megakarya]